MISSRFIRLFSTSTALFRKSILPIPQPTKEIPDVNAFLNKIGQGTSEFAETFENKWEKFFTMPSREMKTSGIDCIQRKYILEMQQKFRLGLPVVEQKAGKKLNGGERKLNVHLAKKKVLNRIKVAQLQRKFRKEETLKQIKYSKWEKLHDEAGHSL